MTRPAWPLLALYAAATDLLTRITGTPAHHAGLARGSSVAGPSHLGHPFSGHLAANHYGVGFLNYFCEPRHNPQSLFSRKLMALELMFMGLDRIMCDELKFMEKHMNSFKRFAKYKFAIHLMLLGVLSVSTAIAQEGGMQLENKAEQRQSFVDENGVEQTRMTDATRVVPGEEIFFTVTYTNSGDEPAENITITNAVPNNMDYVDGSAGGNNATVTFSVDGGNSFDTSESLTVTDTEGSQKPASAVDYTHIRWVVGSDIAPGASGTVQFSAVVE